MQHKQNSKAWWDDKYQKSTEWLYSKTPSGFLTSYLDLLPPQAKALEIASGEGRNAVGLALKGFQVTAIDFSAVALERAKQLAAASNVADKIEFKSGDLDFFIPELLAFDAIISVDFKAPLTLLKNLTRGLKQGGHLFMEAWLLDAMKERSSLEAFECYKPNELLNTLNPASMQLKVLYYSELGPSKWGDKCHLICKKTQLF